MRTKLKATSLGCLPEPFSITPVVLTNMHGVCSTSPPHPRTLPEDTHIHSRTQTCVYTFRVCSCCVVGVYDADSACGRSIKTRQLEVAHHGCAMCMVSASLCTPGSAHIILHIRVHTWAHAQRHKASPRAHTGSKHRNVGSGLQTVVCEHESTPLTTQKVSTQGH